MKKKTTAKSAAKDVEEYLAQVPEPARTTLMKVRAAIRSAAGPDAIELISYGIPAFKQKGYLAGYAAFKNHCSLFAMSGTILDDFKGELKNYRTSKGTIQFPVDKPLPATLVKKLVKARMARNQASASTTNARNR